MMAPISPEVVGVVAVEGVPLVLGEHLTPLGSTPQPMADHTAVKRRQTPAGTVGAIREARCTCATTVRGCGAATSGAAAAAARYVARRRRGRLRGIGNSFRGQRGLLRGLHGLTGSPDKTSAVGQKVIPKR